MNSVLRAFLFLLILILPVAGVAVDASERRHLKAHIECGWFLALSDDAYPMVEGAAREHIVTASSLAVEIGLSPDELESEISSGLGRVETGMKSKTLEEYWEDMTGKCSTK